MKKRLMLLFAAVMMAFPLGAGIAMAGPGENSTGPEGKPCNADHGHPADGLANNKKCAEDGDADADADGADTDGADTDGADTDGTDTDGSTANQCTAASGDPGITGGGTIAQALYDGGLSGASPLVEDPEADGAISGEVYAGGNGTPLEPVTDEAACAVDLLIDPSTGLPDL